MPEKPVEQEKQAPATMAEQGGRGAEETAIGTPGVDEHTPLPAGRLRSLERPRRPPPEERPPPAPPFPYAQLLNYHRRQLRDPIEVAKIEAEVNTSPRWRAHLESVQFLDLERAAAIQDGADLQAFSVDAAGQLCLYAAVSAGEVFERVARAPNCIREETRKEWARHTKECVYCRRMRRQATARVTAEKAGLPPGEPLLREWLLERSYAGPLQQRTEDIIRAFRKKNLRQLVERLPSAEQRDLVFKRMFNKVPVEELAKALGRPFTEVQAQLEAALGKLPGLYRASVLTEMEQLFQSGTGK